jgi:hypothetical protein
MMSKIGLQYLNKAAVARLNKMLAKAGYPPWPGDKTTAEPQGCGEGYALNCIACVAGSDRNDRREVTRMISRVV